MKKNRLTPWSYRKGDTLLHRLPAGIKLIFLLSLSLAAFFPGGELKSLIILAGIILLLIVLSLMAKNLPFELLRGSGPLMGFILFLFLFQGIDFYPPSFNAERLMDSGKLIGALLYCGRIITTFAAGSLLFAVTTVSQIRKSVEFLEKKLRLDRLKIGLGISLMLGFIKSFFEIWEDINLAWKSRAGKNSLKKLYVLLPHSIERMMHKAADTAEAMEARGGG